MADPTSMVRRAYAQLGFETPPELDGTITDYLASRPRLARGLHAYALADTGLELATERRRFHRYQTAYEVPDEL